MQDHDKQSRTSQGLKYVRIVALPVSEYACRIDLSNRSRHLWNSGGGGGGSPAASAWWWEKFDSKRGCTEVPRPEHNFR